MKNDCILKSFELFQEIDIIVLILEYLQGGDLQ